MLYFTSCPFGILKIGLATTSLSSIRKCSKIRSFELELFDMTNEQFVSTLKKNRPKLNTKFLDFREK